jgi:hypothetical protein
VNKRLRRILILSGAIFALGLVLNSLANRGSCSYYGYQTDRETKYAAFVGCMAKVSGNWVLRSELRAVQ